MTDDAEALIANADLASFARDGVVCLRRAFPGPWAERLGDDVRYAERPNAPSPPCPELGLEQKRGERMRGDGFPVVWPPEEREGGA